jgi:type IV pilus assembly protein PilN
MIKVNLLPVKKRKKSKPIPAFLIATVALTILAAAIMFYVNYFFTAKITARKAQVAENENKIKELEKKIKAVEDYEKRNADFKNRRNIIEQLSKNKAMPVKIIDEISNILPSGVWLNTMGINGLDLTLGCTGFTNTDVVNFVNNLKNSKMFKDVYLQESVQTQISGFSAYTFRITFKVNG